MRRIVILSATRAEYGLLKNVIIKLIAHPEIDARLAITGAHLSDQYGSTYREIEADGIEIDRAIPILSEKDGTIEIARSMSKAILEFSYYFEEIRPDGLVVLGDRYETLAVCLAAMNERIPIFHICGGETTEGAIDEAIRHSITKMSYLHFTTTETYRKRVIQLGEDPNRVFTVGSRGVENILHEKLMSLHELEESLHFDLSGNYAVVTYHSVTLDLQTVRNQFQEILNALDSVNMKYIITKANADVGGMEINSMIDQYAQTRENVFSIDSLGMKRYLSAIKYAKLVIGNSSSGISEVPSFHVPTINIGDRQRGRIQAASIINCPPVKEDIVSAINKGLSEQYRKQIKGAENPYANGNSSEKIIEKIEEYVLRGTIDLKKKFYDVNFVV